MDLDNFEFDEVILRDLVVLDTQLTYFEEGVFGWPELKRDIYHYFGSNAEGETKGELMADHLLEAISIAKDSEREVEMCCETSEFVDKELCSLKTRSEAMEQELEDMHIELIEALNQRDKYKEERDELLKLAEYWKQRALEKNTRKAPMFESIGSPPR